jgi:hypothetical protein
VGDKASRGGYDNIGTEFETFLLLLERLAVSTAVDSYGVDGHVVGKPLHLLVNLLCQLTRGGHYYTVDCILRVVAHGYLIDDGQEVGGGLSGAGLGYGYKVATFGYEGYGFFLNRGTVLEVHGIDGVENGTA